MQEKEKLITDDKKSSVVNENKTEEDEELVIEVSDEELEEQKNIEQFEADLVKATLIDDKKDKKSKKKNKKDVSNDDSLLSTDEKLLKDVNDIQRLYEINHLADRLKIASRIVLTCLTIIGLFTIGIYLQYNYVADSKWNVTVGDHKHEYTKFGKYVQGDCERYGYTVYICNQPYCEAETVELDTVLGNHKYKEYTETWSDEKGTHYLYHCLICNKENEVIVPNS